VNPIRRLHQQLARAVWKRLDGREERAFRPQWFLLAGLGGPELRCRPDPKTLSPILPPEDRFWADPFAWSRGASRYVFCEEYPFSTRRGRISVLELGPDLLPKGAAVPIIDEPRHLSYPFLFEYQGQLYMVPETARSRRVDLYRCTQFPHRWILEGSLMTGIEAADATLVEHGGRWWLFCAARHGKERINESLLAFHADSPLSDVWTPHKRNPLVRDYSGGRPGGRIFRDSTGALMRPAQDCVPRYGYGLVLHRIETLTPERYAERRIWRISGRTAGGWRALHHLDWHDGLLVMDAQRLIPVSAAQGADA
jgi:hypothetical protein